MRVLLLTLLAAVLAAPGVRAADPANPPAREEAPRAGTMKIGSVDLTRVWGAYRRRNDFDKEFRALQENRRLQVRGKLDEADHLDKEIQQLAMGTKERLDLEEKRKAALKEADDLRLKSQAELNQRFVAMLNQLFDDVIREVEAVAKEGNFDLIIKDQSLESNVSNPAEAILQIGQRVVLYSKPEYDLTASVLKRLNDKYEADLKKEAPASEAKPSAPQAKPPAPPAKEK